MKYSQLFILLLFLLALTGTALAASDQHGGMMRDGMMNQGAMGEASREYMQSMDRMHDAMMSNLSGSDPDAAFARSMIPHHQGAIDMAKIQLRYGKDPELRKLAQEIIDAQETEIQFMEDWLEEHDTTGQ